MCVIPSAKITTSCKPRYLNLPYPPTWKGKSFTIIFWIPFQNLQLVYHSIFFHIPFEISFSKWSWKSNFKYINLTIAIHSINLEVFFPWGFINYGTTYIPMMMIIGIGSCEPSIRCISCHHYDKSKCHGLDISTILSIVNLKSLHEIVLKWNNYMKGKKEQPMTVMF
jgi:hypothetical protein